MAIFRYDDVMLTHPLDWMLLQNGPITLYYHREILESDLSWLRDHEYQIDLFRCNDWWYEGDFFDAIFTKLAFRVRSLDDLDDDLLDLAIPENSGRVLVYYHYDQFVAQNPDVAEKVLDILAYSARYHLLFGRRMMVLVQSNNPKLSFNKVGGCPVIWNGREFTDQARGL